jgi:hypothetical protein
MFWAQSEKSICLLQFERRERPHSSKRFLYILKKRALPCAFTKKGIIKTRFILKPISSWSARLRYLMKRFGGGHISILTCLFVRPVSCSFGFSQKSASGNRALPHASIKKGIIKTRFILKPIFLRPQPVNLFIFGSLGFEPVHFRTMCVCQIFRKSTCFHFK